MRYASPTPCQRGLKTLERRLSGELGGEPPAAEQKYAFRDVIRQLGQIEFLIKSKQYDQARSSYEQALRQADRLLAGSGLVKYRGQRWMTSAEAADQEMIDQGLVKFEGRWVTPEHKEEREMAARGLVRFRNRWVTPTEKETTLTTEQGMVRHGERWVTKEEKFELDQLARGLVKIENRWVTPAERDRLEAERLAQEERQKREQLAKMARLAYLMSQEFVKDSLKAPASAKFPDFNNDRVIVINADTPGHFLVSAYVDAQNGFGAMLRNEYIIELWPLDPQGERWKAKQPVFLND